MNSGYANTGGLMGLNTSATCTYAYWNSDATQIIGSTPINPKKGIGTCVTGYTDDTISKTSSAMASAAFLTLLNDHSEGANTWYIVSGINGGYPVPFGSAPSILLDPDSDKTFAAQIEGYGAQTAHTVTINNTGAAETGALTIELSGTDPTAFDLSKTGITTIAAGNADSLSVFSCDGSCARRIIPPR